MSKHLNKAPLFPISMSNNSEQNSEIIFAPLFPSVNISTTNFDGDNNVINQILPKCSSYRQDAIEIPEQSPEKEIKKDDIEIINLSSETVSSNDSVEIIENNQFKLKKSSRYRDRYQEKKHKKHSKKKKHKKDKYKKEKKSNDHKQSLLKYDNSYLEYLPKGSANFIEDIPDLKPEDAFRLDRRGDKNNIAFDKLYERYVPKYIQKDVIDLSKHKESKSKSKNKNKRYFLSRKLKSKERNFLYPKENLFTKISNINFIPLSTDHFTDVKINDSTSMYGQVKFHSLSKESSSESKEFVSPQVIPLYDQLIFDLTKMFNQTLHENITDIDKWIDFIRFQDLIYYYRSKNAVNNEFSQDESSELNLHKHILDKKLDICHKALDFNRSSVKLNLLKLKLLSLFSDELQKDYSEVDSEWKNICFLFPNALEIWFEWIYFSLRCERMINFRANSRTRKIFKQSFGSLSKKLLEGQFQSHQIENDLELVLVNLTFFLAEFLSSIDQTEKAISLFQALIEFNLYTPEEIDFNHSFEDWFNLFKKFWDSDVSKIGGSINALESGWKYFQNQVEKIEPDQIKIEVSENCNNYSTQELMDRYENEIIDNVNKTISKDKKQWINSLCWLHMERMRHHLHWLPVNVQYPIHNLDEVEDTERIVLIDKDIKPFLYRLRRTESKFYLTIKFLQFLGIPLITNALDSAFSSSRFEMEFYFDSLFPNNYECSLKSSRRLFEISNKFQNRFENYSEMFVLKRYNLETVAYDDYGTFLPFCADTMKHYEEMFRQSRESFIDNVFEKVYHQFEGMNQQSIILLWLQYKIQLYRKKFVKAKDVKKFIKEILQRYSNYKNPHLYNIYCSFFFEENIHEAITIYFTTIKFFYQNQTKNSEYNPLILRLTLAFIRNLLNLDSIMDQFIKEEQSKNIQLLPKSIKKHNFVIEDFKQIALNTLIVILTGSDSDKLNLDELNRPHNPIQALKAISVINSRWAKRKRKQLEEVHSMIFFLYLTQDIEKIEEFIQEQLLPDSMSLIDFESDFKIPDHLWNLCLERSFYILYIELILREYIQSKITIIGKISLKHIKEIVDQALNTFPDDPIFLALLARIETKFTVLTRPRKFFNDYISDLAMKFQNYLIRRYLNNVDCLFDQFFSIESIYNIFMATLHSELLILDKSTKNDESSYDFHTGMLNRIRNLFKRALNYKDDSKAIDWLFGRSLAHCPTIWRLFIHFEKAECQRKEMTTILYRAFQMCPNHKPLYLDAILLKPNLLKECVDIMMNQELRIRTTIEEIYLFLDSIQ